MQNFLDLAIRLKYMHKKISFIFIILYIFQFVSLEAKSEDLDLSGNIIRIKNDLQEITIGEGLPYVLVDGKILYINTVIKSDNDIILDELSAKGKSSEDKSEEVIIADTTEVKDDINDKKKENVDKIEENVPKNIGEVYLHEMKPDKILINAIVIDAGHGGKDAGAFRGNLLEKNVTLKVAKKVNELLKNKFPDKKIILTRDKDVFLSLDKRSEIANNVSIKYGSSIFVSIHVNASKSPKAYGFETWYIVDSYKRNVIEKNKVSNDKDISSILNSMINEELYEESKTFAMKVQNALDKKIGNETLNRGVKENIYFVVKNSFMPAVLVEVGFLSNKREANQLTNEAYLNKLATGIVNGIGDFINEYEKYNDKK